MKEKKNKKTQHHHEHMTLVAKFSTSLYILNGLHGWTHEWG